MRAACLSLLMSLCSALPCIAGAAKTDLYGKPLPPGAVARLGSVPLWHDGLADFVFLDGGRTILTAGSDGVLRFWHAASGRQTRTVPLQGQTSPGKHPALSRDGKTFVTFDQGKLLFWDATTGKQIQALAGPKAGVAFLLFAPDGETLAVGDRDGQVSLWQWRQRKKLRLPLPERTTDVTGSFHASFSPDGKEIAAGGGWKEPLGIFETATGRQLRRFTLPVSASVFTPDGKQLLVAALENNKGAVETVLRRFDLASGKQTAGYPQTTDEAFFTLALSPDGKRLACAPSERAGLFDAASGNWLHRLSGVPAALAFSPDGKLLAGISDNRVRLWDTSSGKERSTLISRFGSEPITAIGPGGRLLAAADEALAAVALWDLRSGRLVRLFPLEKKKTQLRSLTFTDDGQTLIAAHPSGLLQVWNVKKGEKLRTLQLRSTDVVNGQGSFFYQMKVWPDGKHAAALHLFGEGPVTVILTFWETTPVRQLSSHRLSLFALGGNWSADGSKLALTTLDNSLALLDVPSGATLFRVPVLKGQDPLAFSPDGRLLAARRSADVVAIWETASGREAAKLSAGPFKHLALLTDDRSLVTTSEGELRVWDLATGKERQKRLLPAEATALLPLPAGRLCTPLDDGTALVWEFSPASRPARQASDKELAGWWADLAAADGQQAWAAAWRLGEVPGPALLAFFRKHLKPAADADLKEIQRLIMELGHNRFQVRERAMKRLKEMGGTALPALRHALDNNPTLEVRRRLELLVAQPARLVRSPDVLRRLRAVGVLERLGSPEARRILEELARGLPGAPETEEVRAALRRLSARAAGP